MKKALAVLAIAPTAMLAACGGGESSAPETASDLPRGSEHVELEPSEFTTEITNPYLPLTTGSRWVYRETEDGEPDQKVVVEVLDKTKSIANGVEAVVVRDVVTQGGEPVEITDDWLAQDSEGNVWYLGEDTAEYENGRLVCRCGSFEAGVGGAEPGVIMPADPELGMEYRQEFYEGEAEDKGKVLSLDEMAQAPAGYFPKTLMTRDTNPLEPKVSEHKFFAEGVGLVLAIHHSGGAGREELISFTPGPG